MKLKYLLRILRHHKFSYQNYCSQSSEVEIDIPNRIPRGPTDILKALASTVKRDPTAPHYKYHDDPFLIPYSNFTKRSYALSQESGRKAAQWIRQQHADLFQHKVADPLIEDFIPKVEYNEESEVCEDTLKKLIEGAMVSDAVIVYNLLTSKQIGVTSSTKQSLLELLCYFNEEEPISEDWIEERWLRLGTKSQKESKTWKDGGLAEKLFNELKADVPASYSAVICGMCKYFQVEKAFELYTEALNSDIPLSTETYNSLISKTRLLSESHLKMWELVQTFLNEMAQKKVKPNLKTLNTILETLSKMNTHKNTKLYACQAIAEFKLLNIEPSLTSFYYLLEIFIKNKGQLHGAFSEIMNYVSNKEYSIADTKDIYFFTRAMEICSNHLHSKELVYRLHNFLLTGNNYNLIGDAFSESVYYRYFFFFLTEGEELSKVMEFYDDLVPNVYVPEPAVTVAILKTVNSNMAWELLPRLWSDILLFEQAEISGVLENTLECASQNSDQALEDEMSQIAWSAWEKIEGIKRERSAVQWTASALGNILLILLKSGNKAKAYLVMDKLVRLGSTIMNEPKVEALSLFIDSCIEDSSPDIAIKCIQYCHDIGFTETPEFARRLNTSIILKPQQFQKLVTIVGEDCLKVEAKKESNNQPDVKSS